jgi:hypothetical protein
MKLWIILWLTVLLSIPWLEQAMAGISFNALD